MPVSVQDVTTTKVNFNFQVANTDKKIYAGIFKDFAKQIEEGMPDLSAELDALGKALNSRKTKNMVEKKTAKKKTPPRRQAEIDEDDGLENI